MNVQNSDVNIYVDDVFYGTLAQYFTSKNYKPNCGEKGTFPIKLEPGFHTFSAQSVDGKNTWKGSFNLKENQCLIQGLVK